MRKSDLVGTLPEGVEDEEIGPIFPPPPPEWHVSETNKTGAE